MPNTSTDTSLLNSETYARDIAEAQALQLEAQRICSECDTAVQELAVLSQQMNLYEKLTKKKLTETQVSRLEAELSSIYVNNHCKPNCCWFEKIKKLHEYQQSQQRLVAIELVLSDLHKKILDHQSKENNSNESQAKENEPAKTEFTLEIIKRQCQQWHGCVENTGIIAQLAAQQQYLQSWKEATKTTVEKSNEKYDSYLAQVETQTFDFWDKELNNFMKNDAAPILESLNNFGKFYKSDIQAYKNAFLKLEKTIVTNAKELEKLQVELAKEQQFYQNKLSKVFQYKKIFKKLEDRFHQTGIVCGSVFSRVKKKSPEIVAQHEKSNESKGLKLITSKLYQLGLVKMVDFNKLMATSTLDSAQLKAQDPAESQTLDAAQLKKQADEQLKAQAAAQIEDARQCLILYRLDDKLKEVLKNKQEFLDKRKKTANDDIEKIKIFLLSFPNTTSISLQVENLVKAVEQAGSFESALKLFKDFSRQLKQLQENKLTDILTDAEKFQKILDEMHTDDISDHARENLRDLLKKHEQMMQSQEQDHKQQVIALKNLLPSFKDRVEIFIKQNVEKELTRFNEMVRASGEEFARFKQQLSKITVPADLLSMDLLQLNQLRQELKELSFSALSLKTEAESQQKTLTYYQNADILEDNSLQAFSAVWRPQLAEMEKLTAAVNNNLKRISDAQAEQSQQVLLPMQNQWNALQPMMKNTFDEAQNLANYTLITMDQSIKGSTEWHHIHLAAQEHLSTVKVMIKQISALPELNQLPLSNKAGVASLSDQQHQLLTNLQECEQRLELIINDDPVNLLDSQQRQKIIKQHAADKVIELKIPVKSLFSDKTHKIEDFAKQRVSAALHMASTLTAMSKTLFKAIPQNAEQFLSSDECLKLLDLYARLRVYIQHDVLQYSAIDQRTLKLDHWIKVMWQCEQQGDYQSAYTIYQALQGEPVKRLTSTWQGLPQNAKVAFDVFSNKRYFIDEMEQIASARPIIPAFYPIFQPLTTLSEDDVDRNAKHLSVRLIKLQQQHALQSAVNDRALEEHLLTFDIDQSKKQLAADSFKCEPQHCPPAPTTALRDVGPESWLYMGQRMEINAFAELRNRQLKKIIIDNKLSIYPQFTDEQLQAINHTIKQPTKDKDLRRILKTIGLRLNPEQLREVNKENKQMRYREMIQNPLLREFIGNNLIKSLSPHWTPTVKCINNINKATRKIIPDKDFRQRLASVGIVLSDEQLQAVQRKNWAMNPEVKFNAFEEQVESNPSEAASSEQNASLEKIAVVDHTKTSVSLDILTLQQTIVRFSSLLASDYSTDKLYSLSANTDLKYLQQSVKQLADDIANLAVTMQSLANDTPEKIALHESLTECQQQVQQRIKLITDTIPNREQVFRELEEQDKAHDRRRVIITTNRDAVAQALQCEKPQSYFVIDSAQSNKIVGRFYQADASTVYYYAPLKGGVTDEERQLQQVLASQLCNGSQPNLATVLSQSQPVYTYGPKSSAKEMAQRIYQLTPQAERDNLKISVSDDFLPPPGKKTVGFFNSNSNAPLPKVSVANYKVEKVENEMLWEMQQIRQRNGI